MSRIGLLALALAVMTAATATAQTAPHPLDPRAPGQPASTASSFDDLVPLLDRDAVEPSFFPPDDGEGSDEPEAGSASPAPMPAQGNRMTGMDHVMPGME